LMIGDLRLVICEFRVLPHFCSSLVTRHCSSGHFVNRQSSISPMLESLIVLDLTAYSRKPTVGGQLPAVVSLPTARCRLLSVYRFLPSAFRFPPTAYCRLPSAFWPSADCRLLSGIWFLPTAFCFPLSAFRLPSLGSRTPEFCSADLVGWMGSASGRRETCARTWLHPTVTPGKYINLRYASQDQSTSMGGYKLPLPESTWGTDLP
jgi:hypothetical protein